MKIQNLVSTGIAKVLNGNLVGSTEIHSLGGGEWSLEIYDFKGEFLKEFVGSNGTQEPAEDLWALFDEWCTEVHHSYQEYEAPDGSRGSYKYFLREVQKGHLHGCLVTL